VAQSIAAMMPSATQDVQPYMERTHAGKMAVGRGLNERPQPLSWNGYAQQHAASVDKYKRIGDVVGAMNVENQTGSCILDHLEPSDAGRRKTEEDILKVSKPRKHQRRHWGLHDRLRHVPELTHRHITPDSDDVNVSAQTKVWVEVRAEIASWRNGEIRRGHRLISRRNLAARLHMNFV
jgi:hypothetical protein